MRKRRTIAALTLPLLLTVSACSSSGGSSGKTVQGASVTLTINGEPTTLDPQARDDGNLRDVANNIYDRLLDRTPDGKTLVPELATTLPKQTSPTTWDFTLRTGVKFTDGEPFDATAAAYSINRIIDAKFNSELLSSVSTIVSAKAVSATKLEVTTKAPDPILPSRMDFIAMMAPNAKDASSKPVGTGPYELQTWDRGDHITLKANPGYWGKKPSVTTVTFNYPEESGTRLAQLLSGKTDLVTNLQPNDAKSAPQLIKAPGDNHSLMILNAESGVTSDVRVRQAMNFAVNTPLLAKSIYGGFATPDSCQIMSPSWFGFNPDLKPYAYDLNKAKQLVSAAGASGKTVTMVADASGRWPADRDFAQAVAQAWRDTGLKVNLQLLQFNQYLDKLFNQPARPDTILLYHDNSLFDADRTVSTYYEHGGSGASNDITQISTLADSARSESDQTKRLDDYKQIMSIGCDQALFYFGLHVEDLYGASKRLQWTPRDDSEIHVKDMTVSS
jgi:peptide/nickel transport system substrate-binding protein